MKNKDLLFIIVIVAVAALVFGAWWWQQNELKQEQQLPESPLESIPPAQRTSDKTDDIQASLDELDLGDVDAEFKELDQDVNSL